MTKRKPSLHILKADNLYSWHVYNAAGEIITQSLALHETREEAEEDAANTLIAIVESALQALSLETLNGSLNRMRPVVEAIITSAGTAIETMKDMGYYHPSGLTKKGTDLIRKNAQARLDKEELELERSKAMPGIEAQSHVPITATNSEYDVKVRKDHA